METCDICGEPIEEGQSCYEMPDGMVICTDSDCLEIWAENYRR